MDLQELRWTREPKEAVIGDDFVEIVTEPGTDLWQRTYYHFRNDNAPVLQFTTDRPFFSFSVRVDFKESHHRFDQAGICMYLGSGDWLKASVECESDAFQNLGSVVTNNGWSDWATAPVSPEVKVMWFRLSRRGDDYRVEYSEDGKVYHVMRICHMLAGGGEIAFGVYACSPEDSSFRARFTDFALGGCVWEAHDGQPPDGE